MAEKTLQLPQVISLGRVGEKEGEKLAPDS
jgi:hypothetical protein